MAILRKARGRSVNPGGSQERQVEYTFATIAAGTDVEIPLAYAGVGDLYLFKAFIVNQVTVATDGTNNRQIQLRDKGSNGAGVTNASTQFSTATTAMTAHVATDLLATSGYKLVNGNVLAINFTHNGTGAAITNALVVVVFK